MIVCVEEIRAAALGFWTGLNINPSNCHNESHPIDNQLARVELANILGRFPKGRQGEVGNWRRR